MIKFKDWMQARDAKLQEMGSGPYIGNCTDTSDYQVIGACSDQNSEKKNQSYRKGKVSHKKVNKHITKIKLKDDI